MEILIRAVEAKDAREIHEIRIMDKVRDNILATTGESIAKVEEFFKASLGSGLQFVAISDEKVVGQIGMFIEKNPRCAHIGAIGMMIRSDYQGKGIGSKLLEKILELADDYYMLRRVELTVFTSNEAAINLYRKYGFVIEGTKKYGAVRKGRYEDLYYMGRYRHLPVEDQ
ncbi:MAG: GNAT family N-acetyltransferase [Acidaminobacteraceae bacterium]